MLKKVLIGIVATFLLFMTFMLAVMVPMWEREDAEKAKILAQQRAEILKRNQERFNAMSPKEHLAEAEKIIKTASSGAALNAAVAHLSEAKKKDPQGAGMVQAKFSIKSKEIAKIESAQRAAQMEAEASKESTGDYAQVKCRSTVENGLKAPSTAEFQSTLKDYRGYIGQGVWEIQTKVDAQNSFGAMIRSTFDCKVLCTDSDHCAVIKLKEL